MLRSELHSLDAALQSNLAEVASLRASAARRRELAVAERDGGRPQHGRRFDVEADDFEFRAESREGRAEVCRVEIRALRNELRRAGASKVGGWLRRRGVEVSDVPSSDPSASVH
jgi:hypothetical protein